jgi:hypothetical protein
MKAPADFSIIACLSFYATIQMEIDPGRGHALICCHPPTWDARPPIALPAKWGEKVTSFIFLSDRILIMRSTLATAAAVICALAMTMSSLTRAAHHEEALPDQAERTMAIEIDAEVLAVDLDTRELVLLLPTGEQLTTIVDPAVKRLDEVEPGDLLVVGYIAALAAELREPTEEELENPWVEGVEAGIAGDDMAPGGALLSAVRAVCTIEGMNRLTGTVTILDSRGNAHVIGDVKAKRIEQLRVGQQVVITFTQAVAIGIEKIGRDYDKR